MASIIFNKQRWKTSTPPIYFTVTYDHERSGADMKYQFHISVNPSGTASNGVPWRFGYNIISKITLDGLLKDTHTLKASSPATWDNAITYDSPVLTVSNKTSGEVALKFNVSSENGWNADFNTSLIVDAGISSLDISSGVLGASQVISITRYDDSFRDSISYRYGETTVNVVEKTDESSVNVAVPVSASSLSPNGNSVNVDFIISTYSDSELIGTITKTIPFEIPSSVVPTISSITTTEATSGIASKFGAFIQNKSTLDCSVNASGSYGSTIQSYSVTFQGETFATSTFKTGIIQSTSGKMVAKVTDSRGRTASFEKTITALAYEDPKLDKLTVYRINTTGTETDEGNRIAVDLNYSVSAIIPSSDRTYKVEYRRLSSESFTTIEEKTASQEFIGTLQYKSSPDVSPDYAYQIRFTLTDYFTSVTKIVELPTAFTTFDINASGKGFAFGKVSEMDALEISMIPFLLTGLGGTELQNGSNLNDVITTGKYWIRDYESAQSMQNCPSNYGGHLYVVPYRNPAQRKVEGSYKYAWQVYFSILPEIFVRRIQTGANASVTTFTGWKKLGEELSKEEENLKVTFVSSKTNTSREYTYSDRSVFPYTVENVGMLGLCVVMSYVRSGVTHGILIDAGSDYNAECLISNLNDLNVSVIDAVMITHWHGDHWHGLTAINLNTKKLGNADLTGTTFYCPHGGFKSSRLTASELSNISGYLDAGEQYINKLNDAGINYVFPTENQVIEINGIRFTFNNVSDEKFLSGDPVSSYHYFYGQDDNVLTGPDYNNFSMMISVQKGETKIVFSGDVSLPATKANADVICGADIFQVNHHGLNISETKSWLSSIGARYSVIPTYGNMYLSDREPWENDNMHLSHLRCSDVGTLLTTAKEDVVFNVSEEGYSLETGKAINRTFYDSTVIKITSEHVNPNVSGITLTTNETQIEKHGDTVIISFRFGATNAVPAGTALFVNLPFERLNNSTFVLTTTNGVPISCSLRKTVANGTHVWIYSGIPSGATVYGQCIVFCKNSMRIT